MKQKVGMARPLRIEYPSALYGVMDQSQSRRNIYMEDRGTIASIRKAKADHAI